MSIQAPLGASEEGKAAEGSWRVCHAERRNVDERKLNFPGARATSATGLGSRTTTTSGFTVGVLLKIKLQ
jgi:hypothetical protein